jgi:hypothetical protein
MLKIIQKTFFLSLFACSFVFPMGQVVRVGRVALAKTLNQSAPFRNSLPVRCPDILAGMMVRMMDEEATRVEVKESEVPVSSVNDSVKRDQQNMAIDNPAGVNNQCEIFEGQKRHVISMLPQSKQITNSFQSQLPFDMINERFVIQDKAHSKYQSEMIYKAKAEAVVKTISSEEKLQLFSDISKSSTIVQHKTSQLMQHCSSLSLYELQVKKADIVRLIPQLKTQLQSLIRKNSNVDLFINAEQYCLTRGLILQDPPGRLSLQDLYEIKAALNLEVEIKSREAASQQCDAKIRKFEQEALRLQEKQEKEALLLKEQQEQEALLVCEQLKSQHESLDFSIQNCPDTLLENQYCQRQDALSLTQQQGCQEYGQEYYLSPQAAAYLQVQGVDYFQVHNFHGTALQQQLHSEVCDIFERAATMQAQLSYQSDLLKQAVLCADAAYDANQLGQIKTVVSLNNLGFTLLEYGKAVVTGALQGCENVAYTVTHLEEAAESVGKAVYYVLETVALNNYTGSEDACIQFRDQRNVEIMQGLSALGSAIENSTGPQKVQALTQFAVEFCMPGKIVKAVGGVLGFAESAAVKGANSIQTEINAVKTAQQMEVVAQEQIVQNVAKRCKIFTVTELVDKIRKFGGKIPAHDITLVHNAQHWIEQVCVKVNTKIDGTLLEQYNKMTQIVGNAEMSVCMDLEHIVNLECKLILDKSKSFYTVDLKGGHLAGTMSKLAKEGLVEIKSFVEFGGGCREYQVKNLLTGREFIHTEFSAHWNVEKIAQEAKYLVENAIKNGSLLEKINKPVIAITSDGFELKIITEFAPEVHDCVSIKNTANRHIVTARPYKG